MWAHDAQMDVPDLKSAIAELVQAGLIDYDEDEQFVRINGWFHKRSGPDNPNRVDSVIADLCSMDCIEDEMLCKAVSELAVASVKRSLRWKEDAPGRAQLYGSLKAFLAEVYQDHGDAFLALLSAELSDAPATVSLEMKVIFPVLNAVQEPSEGKGSERVTPTLREHETRRRRDLDETNTKKNKDEKKTAHFSDGDELLALGQASVSELPRRGVGPTVATLQSRLVQQARSGT